MSKPEFDICVIGGGSAGLVAAAGAALLGAKVALIEKRALGGDCLYTGCVPSKALLHSAGVAHMMRDAPKFGIPAQAPEIELAGVMQRVQSVIKSIAPHDSPERFRGLGIEVIFGSGHFTGRSVFELDQRAITAKNFVLATGSKPAVPDIPGLQNTPYLTNESVFDLNQAVPSLIVLGGGAIGIEMAQAFRRLGSEVHVIEREPRILEQDDDEAVQVVAERLRAEGVHFHLQAAVENIEGSAGAIRVRFKGGNRQSQTLAASHLLVATGRRANVEGLALAVAGVALDRGSVKTDARLRTSNKRVYACGDVTSHYRFTHVAEYQAGVVLRNALFHWPAKNRPTIPWCTFTDPELAHVGLTERQAREQRIAHEVYRSPFVDNDRAHTEGDTVGFAKIITDKRGRLLGASLVGPHAGELIHEYVVLAARRRKIDDLAEVIHIYPTLAQINVRVARERNKARLTPTAKKWIKCLFRLRGR